MIIGKITVRVEYTTGSKNLYCRPISSNRAIFNSIIGIGHRILVKKCSLTQNLTVGDYFTTYAIFKKITTQEQFNRSFCVNEIYPITEDVFNQLNAIYPQNRVNHAFQI